MAKAQNCPPEDEEYYAICAGIIPLVSDIIDERGGLSTLAAVGSDPRMKEAIKQLPSGKSRKTRDIVNRFPEYISMFPKRGLVATAKGYEEGLVNDDGTISQELLDQMIQQPYNPNPKQAIQNGGMMTSTQQSVPQPAQSIQLTRQALLGLNQELLRVSKELQKSCMNQDNEAFEQLVQEMVQLRAQRWPTNENGARLATTHQLRGRAQQNVTAHPPPHAASSARHLQQNRVVQFNGVSMSTALTSTFPSPSTSTPRPKRVKFNDLDPALVEQYIDTIVGVVHQFEAAGREPTLSQISNQEAIKDIKEQTAGTKVSDIVRRHPDTLSLAYQEDGVQGPQNPVLVVAPTYRGCPVTLPPLEPLKIRKKPRGLKRQREEQETITLY